VFPGGGLCLSHRECEIPNPFSPALELSETPRAPPVPRTSRTPWSLDARELAGRWIPELVTQGRRARALAAGGRLALGPLRPPPVLPDLHGALHRELVPRLQGGASQAESRLSFGCGALRAMRNNSEIFRKIHDQVLGDAVREILLVGISAQTAEWQNND